MDENERSEIISEFLEALWEVWKKGDRTAIEEEQICPVCKSKIKVYFSPFPRGESKLFVAFGTACKTCNITIYEHDVI